ncbi:helix-turn-helix transcriptional regulator [Massilia sp. MB5]|uniref:winged helix-turn-helix transcriptional regulator n=1 Tax=Massilia sp. MB5 TaxID=2919578 RepID=UPI001F0E60F1|nr:helix-turn-helix domain-containing protein [Massilia sp. MB5]UMR33142.1 helix-turn-helix transcriptional regulator [Massilia sp. MB5]
MGKQKQEEFCPVARTLDLIGDRWSLLIVRDAFDGICRFGEFQRNLGIARNILSDRLQKLVEAGVLEVAPASDGTAYQEYLLTARGRDLFTVVVGLRQWGEQHLYAKGEARSSLLEIESGKPVPQLALRRRDGSALKPEDTVVRKVKA